MYKAPKRGNRSDIRFAVFPIQVPPNIMVENVKAIKLTRPLDLRLYEKDQHSLGRLKAEENGEFLAPWESMSEYIRQINHPASTSI